MMKKGTDPAPYRATGEFRVIRNPAEIVIGFLFYQPACWIEVPLWLLWLVFVGCAFAFCKLMERRSGSGKEKELADRVAGNPS